MHQDNLYLVDALETAPETLSHVLHNFSPASAAEAPENGWSIVQVLCHMRDNEERAIERMRLMRDQPDPLIESYDQEAWATERGYASEDFRSALDAFGRFRGEHTQALRALSPDQWERTGRHAERGATSIQIQTMRLLCHDSIHIAQICRLLAPS